MKNKIIIEQVEENKTPFASIVVSRRMLFLKDIGRLCECGCNQTVIGPRRKRFVSPKHKNAFLYKSGRSGKPSTKTVQALVAINVNYDGTRNITLWFKKGVKKDIRITRNNCSELWDTLNQISEFRNRA